MTTSIHTRFFITCTSHCPSRQVPQTGHDRFFPNPFHFIINQPMIQRYIIWDTHCTHCRQTIHAPKTEGEVTNLFLQWGRSSESELRVDRRKPDALWKNIPPPSSRSKSKPRKSCFLPPVSARFAYPSTLKMDAIISSQKAPASLRTTRYYNP
jgi:hypothetical protein